MITVKVSLPDYLAQWALAKFVVAQDASLKYIVPLKGSPLSQFLRNFLRHKKFRPKIEVPPGAASAVIEGVVDVFIGVPKFPGRDPVYYNYLSPVAEAQLRDLIRSRFDIELFTDFSRFKNVNMPINEFIFSWINANGIEMSEKNFLAVEKRLQMLRRKASDRIRKKKQ